MPPFHSRILIAPFKSSAFFNSLLIKMPVKNRICNKNCGETSMKNHTNTANCEHKHNKNYEKWVNIASVFDCFWLYNKTIALCSTSKLQLCFCLSVEHVIIFHMFIVNKIHKLNLDLALQYRKRLETCIQ